MSPKSSVPQADRFDSYALMSDTTMAFSNLEKALLRLRAGKEVPAELSALVQVLGNDLVCDVGDDWKFNSLLADVYCAREHSPDLDGIDLARVIARARARGQDLDADAENASVWRAVLGRGN